jgi:hypothetical protein
MSRHNDGMRWVIGALGLLLYMGSFSTGVVRTVLFSRPSLPLCYPQTHYGITVFHCQKYMQHHRSGSGCYKFVSGDGSYFGTCPYITFFRGENFSGSGSVPV